MTPNQSIDPSLNQTIQSVRWSVTAVRYQTRYQGLSFSGQGARFAQLRGDIVIVQFWVYTRISTQRCKVNILETKLTVHMLAKPSKDLQLQPRSVKEGRRKTGILGAPVDIVTPKLNTWIPLANRHKLSQKRHEYKTRDKHMYSDTHSRD